MPLQLPGRPVSGLSNSGLSNSGLSNSGLLNKGLLNQGLLNYGAALTALTPASRHFPIKASFCVTREAEA